MAECAQNNTLRIVFHTIHLFSGGEKEYTKSMKQPPHTFIIQRDEDGLRLDRVLKSRFPRLPYGLVQKAFRTGKIRYQEKRTKDPTLRVAEAASVTLFLDLPQESGDASSPPETKPSKFLSQTLKHVPEWILFEDEDLLILNKPAGFSVQAGSKTPFSLDRLLTHYAESAYKPRVTHRLDKETSGVLVFAKTREAARHMTELFKNQTPEKTYWTFTTRIPDPLKGCLDAPLGKLTGVQKEKMSSKASEVRPAITFYHVRQTNPDHHLAFVELSPKTGRTHQIRVHCAESGFPVLGDGKYGGRQAHPFHKRIPLCLHARCLRFPHPNGDLLTIEAPLPPLFKDILDAYFPDLSSHSSEPLQSSALTTSRHSSTKET